jgi:hypothetical protein
MKSFVRFSGLSAALLLLSSHLFAQTIRRVNNNFGASGANVYSTPQAANDAAQPGDIMIIEPSSTSYGDLTITKPLKIYGNGYFLSTNTELKADQRSSVLAYVYFDTGSNGSEIYGLDLYSSVVKGASNIKIARSKMSYIYIYNYDVANVYHNVTDILVEQNYISGSVSPNGSSGYTIANVIIKNNILGGVYANSDPYIQSWVVTNNTFINASTVLTLSNSVAENNLFNNAVTVTFYNSTASYNVSAGTTFNGIGVGNIDNYPVPAELTPGGPGISSDENYMVQAGSPLKTAGNGGIEVGAFGGGAPYVISGIPATPAVLKMINSATGDGSNPLQVTISVKSNN